MLQVGLHGLAPPPLFSCQKYPDLPDSKPRPEALNLKSLVVDPYRRSHKVGTSLFIILISLR